MRRQVRQVLMDDGRWVINSPLNEVLSLRSIHAVRHREVYIFTIQELLRRGCDLVVELLTGMPPEVVTEATSYVLEKRTTQATTQDVDQGIAGSEIFAFLIRRHNPWDVVDCLLSSTQATTNCGPGSYPLGSRQVIHCLDELEGAAADVAGLGGGAACPADAVCRVDDLGFAAHRHDGGQQANGVEQGAKYLTAPEGGTHAMCFHTTADGVSILLLGVILGHGGLDDTLFLTVAEP